MNNDLEVVDLSIIYKSMIQTKFNYCQDDYGISVGIISNIEIDIRILS